MSSLERKVFAGASWLGLLKLVGQAFSWAVTIIVARILVPEDFGLVAMATIVIGLGQMFSEFGLGAAIIQRPKTTKKELSSVFWFAISVGVLLAITGFFSAYLLAILFKEPRIVPLTQAASVIFILSGLQIVPLNILKKKLEFKKVGLIELKAIIVSNIIMVSIAYMGAGAWTLIYGPIGLSLAKLFFLYSSVKWYPILKYSFRDAKEYLKFGINVSLGRIFFYFFESSDKFFAGRIWEPRTLGFYTFALQLAQIPTEKLVVMINQVSFSALSELQDKKEQFNKFYLRLVKVTATVVFPIFIGGYLVGDELIKIVFNPQWEPMIPLFRLLCLAQIMTAINAINSYVHYAQGRPKWSMVFNATLGIFMPLSFYLAVPYGLNAILIPWFSTYLVICSIWIIVTNLKIGLSVLAYLTNIFKPFLASLIMVAGVTLAANFVENSLYIKDSLYLELIIKIIVAIILYAGFIWFFDKGLLNEIKKMKNT